MDLTLVKKINESKDTVSFFWKTSKKITWLPGQYYYYTLDNIEEFDPRGPTRHFTISSSPTEGEILQLTTKIRKESAYKKALDKIEIGSKVNGEGPQGTFVFDESQKGNQIFLAGGIGITPFRSFIKYIIDKNINLNIYLVYSNSGNDFIFKKELDDWLKTHSNLKVEYFNSEELGRLDTQKLTNILNKWNIEIKQSTFWVVGPPPFVSGMEDLLETQNISEDSIKTEKFTGY